MSGRLDEEVRRFVVLVDAVLVVLGEERDERCVVGRWERFWWRRLLCDDEVEVRRDD